MIHTVANGPSVTRPKFKFATACDQSEFKLYQQISLRDDSQSNIAALFGMTDRRIPAVAATVTSGSSGTFNESRSRCVLGRRSGHYDGHGCTVAADGSTAASTVTCCGCAAATAAAQAAAFRVNWRGRGRGGCQWVLQRS